MHTTPKNKKKYKETMEENNTVKVRSSKMKIFSNNEVWFFWAVSLVDSKTRPTRIISENNFIYDLIEQKLIRFNVKLWLVKKIQFKTHQNHVQMVLVILNNIILIRLLLKQFYKVLSWNWSWTLFYNSGLLPCCISRLNNNIIQTVSYYPW